MPLQQTSFENIMEKGEIVHDEQFLYFPKCFQLYSISVLSFIKIFLDLMFSKFSTAYLFYAGKVFKQSFPSIIQAVYGEYLRLNTDHTSMQFD